MGEGVDVGDAVVVAPSCARPFSLGHVPALDGLRGVAVAGVLVFHGNHLVGGFLGVDLFFVLSGFLITSLLLREWSSTRSIGLAHFWARRARRLLPALFGLLAGVAIYTIVWAKPYELDSIRSSALATVLYVANWQSIWAGHGYWDLFTTPSPLQHTWSLAIEEQFYLVWPLVVLFVLRRRAAKGRPGAPAIFAIVLALAIASSLWMMLKVVPGDDPSRVYFGTDTRAGSVLFGAALAAWLAWRGTTVDLVRRRILQAAAVVAALWLVFAWSTIDGQSTFLYRGGFLLCALAVVVIIAACVDPDSGPLAALLSIAPLRWLGLISYGLYLWHWPVFVVLQIEHTRLGLTDWSLFAAQVAVSLLFAVVSFYVLERPIRLRGLAAWGTAGRALMPVAAAMSIVLMLAVTAGGQPRPDFAYQSASATGADPNANVGSPTRATLPEVHDDGPATTSPSPTADPATTSPPASTVPPADDAPIARPSGRTPRLLVVGDSVAYYLGQGIERQPDLGVQVGNQAMYKCTLGRQYGDWKRRDDIVDYENADCRRWPTIWGDAVNRFKPDAVLLSFGGPPQGTLHIGDGWYAPCSTEYHDYYLGEVDAAIDLLTAKGATLYLAPSAHPRFPFLPDDIDARTDCVNGVYREAAAAHPGAVRILAIDDWTCPPPGKTCIEEVDGANLREDGIHYQNAGADVAARWVVPHVFAPPT